MSKFNDDVEAVTARVGVLATVAVKQEWSRRHPGEPFTSVEEAYATLRSEGLWMEWVMAVSFDDHSFPTERCEFRSFTVDDAQLHTRNDTGVLSTRGGDD